MSSRYVTSPRMAFGEYFIEQMRSQVFSVRHRHQPDPQYPGWTFADPNHADQTILRYDENGQFWLWKLTSEMIGPCVVGAWPD